MFAKVIEKKRVDQLMEKGALLVDMRSPVAFRNGSINGAVNLPLKNFLNRLSGLDKKTRIILFSDSAEEDDITTGAKYAFQLGFSNLFISEYKQLK